MAPTPSGAGSSGEQQLLERSSELAQLARHLQTLAETGDGRTVVVTGEAGVGKTALLRAFRGDAAGTRFLWGACDPLFTPRALGAVHDVAEQAGGDLRDLVVGGAKPYEVAMSLLRELALRPTALVLEDVHWADEASLDVLRLLIGRLEGVPALVLASYRDDDIGDHPFRRVLGELMRQSSVARLPLERLSEQAVATLAAPRGVDAGELYRTTAGNPFFVTEVLAAGGERIPTTVRDAVLARADRLSEQARRVLEAVAVGSGATELWLLERVVADEIPALDECLAGGILTADGAAVAFRHELARLAVEASLPPHRRLSLHRATLAALTNPSRGAPDLARLAHHAEAAEDTAAVLRYAPVAAQRAAAVGAHREAAAQYARALRFADDLALRERADLLSHVALEYGFVGRLTDAIALRRRAAEAYRAADDRLGEGNALLAMAWPLWTLGRRDEAERAARDAIAVLAEGDADRELARAYGTLSLLCATASDLEGTIAAGARALELAERAGDARASVQARTHMAGLRYVTGDESGRDELERSLEIADRAGLTDEIASAYCWLTRGAARTRDHASAARYAEAGIELCNRHDLEGWRPLIIAYRCEDELERGDWDAAEASATLVLEGQGTGPATVAALAVAGRLRARRAERDPWPLLDRAREVAEPSRELSRLAAVAVARCEAAWLEGRDGDALRETEAAWSLAVVTDEPWVGGELAQWRRRVGADEEPAAEIAEPYAVALAGDWRRASALWSELGCPYDAALAAAEGDEEHRRQALEHLQALGARATAAVVARRLRERGARGLPRGPRPQTTRNPAQLTAREVEIVGLLVEGLRNAEIAERLFISKRTADHHVSAILRKLELTSRAQVAAAAARLGLAGK